MEFNEYVRAVQRRWPIVVVSVLLGLALGYLTADPDADPTQFSATNTLSVEVLGESDQQDSVSLTPSQIAFFATVGVVPEKVAEAIDHDGSPQSLAQQVDVQADDELGFIEITATDESGARAVEIADAFGETLTQELRNSTLEQLEAELATTQAEVLEFGTRIEQIDAELTFLPPNAAVLTAQRDALVNQYRVAYDRAQALRSEVADAQAAGLFTLERATARPVGEGFGLPDDTVARMVVLGLFGLGLGLAAAFVTDRLDTRIQSRSDLSAAATLPVLAEVPLLPHRNRDTVVTAVEPASPFAESYRNLRTTLDFVAAAHDPSADDEHDESAKVILVTSSGPSEAKTTTVAHLAASYAETNRSVLVLDCDFRRPRLHRIFDVPDRPGFSDALIDPDAFMQADVMRETELAGLRLVPAGTPTDNPAHLFTLSRRLIDGARSQADIVIIDTPPMLTANDAAELMEVADTTLVTVRAHQTRRDSVERMCEQLERLDVPVAGVVLVGTKEPAAGYGAYYRYGTSRTDRPRGWRRLLFWRYRPGEERIRDEDIPPPADASTGEDGVDDEDVDEDEDVAVTPVDASTGEDEGDDEDAVVTPVDASTGEDGVDLADLPAGDGRREPDNGDAALSTAPDRDDVGASSP